MLAYCSGAGVVRTGGGRRLDHGRRAAVAELGSLTTFFTDPLVTQITQPRLWGAIACGGDWIVIRI